MTVTGCVSSLPCVVTRLQVCVWWRTGTTTYSIPKYGGSLAPPHILYLSETENWHGITSQAVDGMHQVNMHME